MVFGSGFWQPKSAARVSEKDLIENVKQVLLTSEECLKTKGNPDKIHLL